MGRFDYPEDYSVRLARQSIRESLMSHGELSIAFAAYHPSTDEEAQRLRCTHYDDVYKDKLSENHCSICYDTSYTEFRDIRRVWAIYTDSEEQEVETRRGTWAPRVKNIQTEHSPQLINGDYIVRVSYWEDTKPLVVEEVYRIDSVSPESLRTGARFGQAYFDIVGQKFRASKTDDEHPLYNFPFREIAW